MKKLSNEPVCDVMRPDCPARALLAVLGDKWALLLLYALSEGPQRNGALRRRVGDISEKMLMQILRRLEAAGLVERTAYDEVPPRVDYALSAPGRSLIPLVAGLNQWTEGHALDLPGAGALRRAPGSADD